MLKFLVILVLLGTCQGGPSNRRRRSNPNDNIQQQPAQPQKYDDIQPRPAQPQNDAHSPQSAGKVAPNVRVVKQHQADARAESVKQGSSAPAGGYGNAIPPPSAQKSGQNAPKNAMPPMQVDLHNAKRPVLHPENRHQDEVVISHKMAENPEADLGFVGKSHLEDKSGIVGVKIVEEKDQPLEAAIDVKSDAEDKELKMKMEAELEAYHEVKKRIQLIEEHLITHADFNVVSTKELLDAAETLKTLKDKIIVPLEKTLLSVRAQVKSLHHKFTPQEKTFIKSVIDNADDFLSTSKIRIENLEFIDRDWMSLEESEMIREAVEADKKKQGSADTPDFLSAVKSSFEKMQEDAGGMRSKRLKMVKKVVAQKKQQQQQQSTESMREKEVRQQLKKEEGVKLKVDIHQLKMELDRERLMDEQPGYAKKIKEAMAEAAEQSHKFIQEKLNHKKLQEEHYGYPAWLLIIIISAISATILVLVICMICRKRTRKTWKRNMFKPSDGRVNYCELNDVRGERNTGLENSWADTTWASWDKRNSQKLK